MHTALPLWFESGSLIVLILILAGDLFLVVKRPHTPSMRESAAWVSFYVALAGVFAVIMFTMGDPKQGSEFLAGWLTEYSLSIDNLFVFLVIIGKFAVPRMNQQEVLMGGILIALVLRGVFILAGAGLIANFSWIFYIFGGFLLYTAVTQALENSEQSDAKENPLIRLLRRRIRITDHFDGPRLTTRIDGAKYFTPMLLVFLAIGSADLVFALDSIPAIFGITESPFIVFTANIFALMGLRQLYFMLGGLLDKLEYLKYGIAVILAFIGVKLVLHAMHDNELPFIAGGNGIEWAPEISTWLSLAVIVAAMVVASGASLIKILVDRRRSPDQR